MYDNRFRSKKAINTILTVLGSLTLSEKQFVIESKCNNRFKNINKLILLVLFPFFFKTLCFLVQFFYCKMLLLK